MPTVVTINRENYTSKFFAECCDGDIEVGAIKFPKMKGKTIGETPSASGNKVKETKGDPKAAAKKGWKPTKVQVNNSEQRAVEHRLTMNAVRAAEAPVELVDNAWTDVARAASALARRAASSGVGQRALASVKGSASQIGKALSKTPKVAKTAAKITAGGAGVGAGAAMVAGGRRRKRKALEAERRYKSGERESERQHEKEMSGALSERARLKESHAERKQELKTAVTRKERQQEAARERRHEQALKPTRYERMTESKRERKHELKLKAKK